MTTTNEGVLDNLRVLRLEYRAARDRAKIQLQPEFEARIDELTRDTLVALSQAVHQAHAQGISKAIINAAIGVHSNAAQANPVWNAYTPDMETDLRRQGASRPSGPLAVRVSEDEFDILLPTGEKTRVTGVQVVEDEDERYAVFTLAEEHAEHYAHVNQALLDFKEV